VRGSTASIEEVSLQVDQGGKVAAHPSRPLDPHFRGRIRPTD
jgi:hypothetical protein